MPEIAIARVDGIEFEISVKNKVPVGQAIVDFTIVYADSGPRSYSRSIDRQLRTKIPLDTLWIDRDNMTAVKSHLRISSGNALHKILFSATAKLGQLRTQIPGQLLTADKGKILRFGTRSSENYSDNDADFNTYYMYDSYVQAIKLCLRTVSEHKQVGGLGAISFRHINPQVLIEFGFEEIKDFFGIGPSMWKGNADTFLKMSNDYVSTSEMSRNAKSFLDYIRSSLDE